MVENFSAHITPFGLTNIPLFTCSMTGSRPAGATLLCTCLTAQPVFDFTATYGLGPEGTQRTPPQAIIVAPECNHEGNARLEEQPLRLCGRNTIGGPRQGVSGLMVQELKPLIDAKYPTLPDREHSHRRVEHGRLMSLYGVTAHNETFSRAACLSPSVRFSFFTEVKGPTSKAGSRHAGLYQLGRARGQWTLRAPVHTGKALEVTNLPTAGGATVHPYCRLTAGTARPTGGVSWGAALHFCSWSGGVAKQNKSKKKAPRPAGPGGQARPNRARAGAAAPHG